MNDSRMPAAWQVRDAKGRVYGVTSNRAVAEQECARLNNGTGKFLFTQSYKPFTMRALTEYKEISTDADD